MNYNLLLLGVISPITGVEEWLIGQPVSDFPTEVTMKQDQQTNRTWATVNRKIQLNWPTVLTAIFHGAYLYPTDKCVNCHVVLSLVDPSWIRVHVAKLVPFPDQ